MAAAAASGLPCRSPLPLTHTDFIGSWMRAIKDVTRIVPREVGENAETHERHIERASIEHSLANLRTFPWIRMKENKQGTLAPRRLVRYRHGRASCL